MKRLSSAVALIFALSLGALLLFHSKECSQAVVAAIQMCINTLIPSLFPFLFLSQFCMKTGLADKLARRMRKVTGKVLKLPDCASGAMIAGFLGGYPVGAKYIGELCKNRYINRSHAEQMLLFCNNCGPAFFLGAIGTAVFSSAKIGLALWVSHILSAVVVFFILRNKSEVNSLPPYRSSPSSLSEAFCSACWNAAVSAAKISAYVILFNVLTLWFNKLPTALLAKSGGAFALIKGTFELTSGIMSLSANNSAVQICLAAFMTGWGGICVHAQTMSVLQGTGIKLKRYMLAKLLHALISSAIIYIFLQLCSFGSVSAVIVQSKAGPLNITAKSGVIFTLPWLGLAALIPLCIKREKDDDKL